MRLSEVKDEKLAENHISISKRFCIKGTEEADKGNLNNALEIFNKAVDANPKNHVAYFNRATIKIDLGDVEGARNDFFKFDKLIKYTVH